ncbi:hypothetical protein [Rufibacter sp. XAAS-G3-1]|uniref:hypothetical protein n=1 Tax=Rufibacter sp. XAAS-G3-1 TaxID=2729134 RepID=UPI0015E78EA9|nr:hypothetical protein [Rufibacter sp. XAAS-G3-1]
MISKFYIQHTYQEEKQKVLKFEDIKFSQRRDSHPMDTWRPQFDSLYLQNCFLIKEPALKSDGDKLDFSNRETRFFIIEPMYEIINGEIIKFLKISLIEGEKQLTNFLEHLHNIIVDSITYYSEGIVWIKAIELLIRHFLESELITNTKFKNTIYKRFDFEDIIAERLRKNHVKVDSTLESLRKVLMPEKYVEPIYVYTEEESYDTGYSQSELNDMYRAAYEDDEFNLWNND